MKIIKRGNKTIFISLGWRVFVLLTLAIIVAGGPFIAITLNNAQQYYNKSQQKKFDNHINNFEHLISSRTHQLANAVQELTLHGDTQGSKSSFESLFKHIDDHWLDISIAYEIDGIAIFDQSSNIHGSKGRFPQETGTPWLNRIRNDLFEPGTNIVCAKLCDLMASVPIVFPSGEEAILIMVVNLADIIREFKYFSPIDLALVSPAPASPYQLQNWRMNVLASSAPDRTIAVLEDYSRHHTLSHNIPPKHHVIGEQRYEITAHILPAQQDPTAYIVFIEDTTEIFATSVSDHRRQLIAYTILLIILLCGITLFIYRGPMTRLSRLSMSLPLLAKNQFDLFRKQCLNPQSSWRDELDVLNIAGLDLCLRLELLSKQVDSQTQDLRQLALFDPLTDLPNRAHLIEEIKRSIDGLGHKNKFLSFVLIDIDQFKLVNESLGHQRGDSLLKQTALRISTALPESAFVARYSNDVFAVLLDNLNTQADCINILEKVYSHVRPPIKLEQLSWQTRINSGIVFTQDNLDTATDLFRKAEMALNTAKSRGHGQYEIYSDDMQLRVMESVLLDNQVEESIQRNDFYLVFQPQYDCQSGKMSGCEALIRWQHPSRGVIAPDQFLPIIEESGRIIELGYWVIDESFRAAKTIVKLGHQNFRMAINISAAQLLDANLGARLMQAAKDYDVPTSAIELEITETVAIRNMNISRLLLSNLRAQGFTIAIDDFGTGYSSLSYFKSLPADVIKIDREFVRDVVTNAFDDTLVQSVVNMAHILGLKVVAEGIEEKDQFHHLAERGIDIAQGYYFCKPVALNTLLLMLSNETGNEPK